MATGYGGDGHGRGRVDGRLNGTSPGTSSPLPSSTSYNVRLVVQWLRLSSIFQSTASRLPGPRGLLSQATAHCAAMVRVASEALVGIHRASGVLDTGIVSREPVAGGPFSALWVKSEAAQEARLHGQWMETCNNK